MREICTSGSVGGEDGNILTYPATVSRITAHHIPGKPPFETLPQLDYDRASDRQGDPT